MLRDVRTLSQYKATSLSRRDDCSLDISRVHPHERVVSPEHVPDVRGNAPRQRPVLVIDVRSQERLGGSLELGEERFEVELKETRKPVEDDLALGERDDSLSLRRVSSDSGDE